jgi:hypothetical protein
VGGRGLGHLQQDPALSRGRDGIGLAGPRPQVDQAAVGSARHRDRDELAVMRLLPGWLAGRRIT